MILLSFDKTMELLMCIKEMKGRLKVGFSSFEHLGKMSETLQCGMRNFQVPRDLV